MGEPSTQSRARGIVPEVGIKRLGLHFLWTNIAVAGRMNEVLLENLPERILRANNRDKEVVTVHEDSFESVSRVSLQSRT